MSSTYNQERFATENQHKRDAEYILEEVLKRRRYSSATRDNLASKLSQIAHGHPLKPRRKSGQTKRHV